MFCPDCGVEFNDVNQEKCLACGKEFKKVESLEEPVVVSAGASTLSESMEVAPAEPAEPAAAAAEPSATEPAESAEPATEPDAPAEPAAVAAMAAVPPAKKPLYKNKIFMVAAILVLALVLTGVAGFAFFRTQIKMIFMSPAQVYQGIEADNITSSVSSMLNVKMEAPKSVKMGTELSVDNMEGNIVSQEVLDILKALKVVMNMDVDLKNYVGNVDMAVTSGTDELFKFGASADTSKIGVNFPVLDDNYYTTDFSATRGDIINTLDANLNPMKNFYNSSGITQQQLQDILISYGKEILINNIDKATVEYNKGVALIDGDKYSSITVTYNGTTLKKILDAFANKVKSDTVLKKALYTYITNSLKQTASLSKSFGTEAPPLEISEIDFNKSIDEAMDSVLAIQEPMLSQVSLKNTIYYDAAEKIVARELEVSTPSGEIPPIKLLFTGLKKNGTDIAGMNVSAAGMTLMNVQSRVTGDKYTGNMIVTIPGTFSLDMKYAFDKKDAQGTPVMVGNATINGSVSDQSSYPDVTKQEFEMKFDTTETIAGSEYLTKITGSIGTGVDKAAVSVNVKEKFAPASAATVPIISTAKTVDVATMSQEDMANLMADLQTKMLEKLEPFMDMFESMMPQAGLPLQY